MNMRPFAVLVFFSLLVLIVPAGGQARADDGTAKKLLALAREKFAKEKKTLTPMEEKFFRAAAQGGTADYSSYYPRLWSPLPWTAVGMVADTFLNDPTGA